jgi:glycosyltransferase involved in cell wall biosynthesis
LAEGVKATALLGHQNHVVLPWDGALRERLDAVSEVDVLPFNPWFDRGIGWNHRVRWMGFNLAVAVPSMCRLIRRVRPDVFVTNTLGSPVGALAARACGVPHVWFIREYGTRDMGVHFHLGRRLTLTLVRRLSSLVLVNSLALKQHFKKDMPNARIRVIAPAVEVPPSAGRTPCRSDTYRLVLIGEKTPGKGQQEAMRAVALLRARGFHLSLQLVGDSSPEYAAELERLISSLGITDSVTSVPFRTDAFELMADADVALVCSRAEAFGRVAVEAMKVGKPVIGTASGGTEELVRPGWNGLLYPPGDPNLLAACIERLYVNRALGEEMGRRGQAWARGRFSLTAYGLALDQALQEAITH